MTFWDYTVGMLRALWVGIRPPRCEKTWQRNHVLSKEVWICVAPQGHTYPCKWRDRA